jgi:pimeloyl-ACP methyl ester carboxylesterase
LFRPVTIVQADRREEDTMGLGSRPNSDYTRTWSPSGEIDYGDHDWSRMPEREANLALLRGSRSISLPDTGHFAALEQPARVAEILLDNAGA